MTELKEAHIEAAAYVSVLYIVYQISCSSDAPK